MLLLVSTGEGYLLTTATNFATFMQVRPVYQSKEYFSCKTVLVLKKTHFLGGKMMTMPWDDRLL